MAIRKIQHSVQAETIGIRKSEKNSMRKDGKTNIFPQQYKTERELLEWDDRAFDSRCSAGT